MGFTLKKEAAERASTPKSFGRIDNTGKYTGHFTQAYKKVSESGSEGMQLQFVSTDGKTANIYINFIKKDGSNNPMGEDSINAIMVALSLRNIEEKSMTIKLRDWDLQADVDTKVTGYPSIMDKKIGIVFQMTKSLRNNKIYLNPEVRCYFDANTGQDAKEKLLKAEAVAIDKYVAGLSDVHTPNAVKDWETGYENHVDELAEKHGPTDTFFGEDEIPF